MIKRCAVCQQTLYKKLPSGEISIIGQNQNEMYLEGIIKIICSCGHETLVKEEK